MGPRAFRVSDGTRTRDSQDHNLVLYQLNYTHHCRFCTGGLDTSVFTPLLANRFPVWR